MARRRRGNANEMVTIYWADIPAQVSGQVGANKHRVLLSPRFQVAIDRAAAVAGKTDTDPYTAEWRRVETPLDPEAVTDLEATVQAAADQLEQDHPRDRLEALVANGGDDEATQPTGDTP